MSLTWIQRARRGMSRPMGTSTGIFIATVGVSGAGLLRESSVAASFGLGGALDSLVTAVSVLLLVGSSLVSTASAALLPELTRAIRGSDQTRTRQLVGSTVVVSTLAGVVLGALTYVLAPTLAEWLSGRATTEADAVRGLLQEFAVVVIPASAARGALISILQAAEIYALPAGIQIVSSSFMAVAALAIERPSPTELLGWFALGVYVEVVVLFVVVLVRRSPQVPRVRSLVSLMRPIGPRASYSLLATVVFGLNPVIDYAVANRLDAGSAARLSLATRIPLAAAAVIVAVIVTPSYTAMAEAFGRTGRSGVYRILRSRIGRAIALSGLAAAVVAVGGFVVARVFYSHGELAVSDANSIAVTQIAYALGIPFYVSGVLASRALLAADRQFWHLAIGIGGAVVNVVLDVVLGAAFGVNGIALATGAAYLTTFLWMMRLARPRADRAKAESVTS